MNITEFTQRLQAERVAPGQWKACCPAHEDTNASLSIGEGKDGRILLTCFAGCSVRDICEAMEIKVSDLYPERQKTTSTWNFKYGLTLEEYAAAKKLDPAVLQRNHVETATYTSNSGHSYPGVRIPYLNGRNELQGVRWRMRLEKEQGNEPGRFVWQRGSRPCLYGLWRDEAKTQKDVFLVEGESDCHALWQHGINALGIPGVKNWNAAHCDDALQFYDHIYVHIEKDGGGGNLFEILTGTNRGEKAKPSALLSRMQFFSLPEGIKDPSEAWEKNPDPDFFLRMWNSAWQNAKPHAAFKPPLSDAQLKRRKPGASGALSGAAGEKPADESADGSERPAVNKGGRPQADYIGLVNAYDATFRTEDNALTLRHWRNGWYAYNGRCWRRRLDNDMENQAIAFLQRPDVALDYHVQPSANALKSLLLGMRSVSHCGIPAEMEAPSWIKTGESAAGWVAMSNCILNIEQAAGFHYDAWMSGIPIEASAKEAYTRPLTPDLLSVTGFDYAYDPTATCPNFDAWLASTLPDPALQRAAVMLMGLCLVPDTSYNVAFFLSGEGGTGKSTFLDILSALMTPDNTCRVPLLKFEEKFSIWPLAESLVNIVGEMPTDDPQGRLRYIEGDFKDSISGGMLTIERKGKDVYMARCTARHIFATNSLPIFFDKSEGIWDRLVILPFERRFRNTTEEVRDIKSTIVPAELPGIFNRALAGLADLRQSTRFPEPEACRIAKQFHRDRCDFDASYLRDTYSEAPGCYVPLAEAYKAYCNALRDNGLQPRSSPTFQQAMYRIFRVRPQKMSSTDSTRVFKGIGQISTIGSIGFGETQF